MERPTLVIAGATGFLGRWFIERYHQKYRIIALSRSAMRPGPDYDRAEWRQVELYSITSTEQAVMGADYALYLVHSMSPTTRLTQGSFEDTDLLLADNFARAARNCGLKQIVFVGGLLPDDEPEEDFSRHLRSRREVEITLGSAGVPVTSLRAGIIVGAGGSSFRMIEKLVRRLPVLICPAWCQSDTHPIALEDTLKIIDYCLGRETTFDRAIDIGGSEVITYMGMLSAVAELLGSKRVIRPVRFFTAGLSTLWVSLLTQTSGDLVRPLVESLRHRMVASDNDVMRAFPDRVGFREMAAKALFDTERLPALPARVPVIKEEKNTVRSVQRLPNPERHTATYVARLYQRWLPIFFRALIGVKTKGDDSTFRFAGIPLLRLTFIPDRSDDDRQLFYIVGGLLAKRKDYGWLEFRRVLDGRYIISAIHEFVPALPWYFYVNTQAVAHTWVMRHFGSYLAHREGEPAAGQTRRENPLAPGSVIRAMKQRKLNDGLQMPTLGLGVWQSDNGKETIDAVHWALDADYRHIDTARIYKNEEAVGKAIKTASTRREDIWLTTKIWNDDIRQGRTTAALDESLHASIPTTSIYCCYTGP